MTGFLWRKSICDESPSVWCIFRCELQLLMQTCKFCIYNWIFRWKTNYHFYLWMSKWNKHKIISMWNDEVVTFSISSLLSVCGGRINVASPEWTPAFSTCSVMAWATTWIGGKIHLNMKHSHKKTPNCITLHGQIYQQNLRQSLKSDVLWDWCIALCKGNI